jgi:hypothetical protein
MIADDPKGWRKRRKLLERLKEAWMRNRFEGLWWARLSVEDAKTLDPDADFSDLRFGELPTLEGSDVEECLRREGMIGS